MKHKCFKNTEIGELTEFDYKIDKLDILLDIKFLISEFYVGTFSRNKHCLNFRFNNGQKFKLTLNEVK